MQCVAQSTPFIGVGLTMLRRRTLVPYLKSRLPARLTRGASAAAVSTTAVAHLAHQRHACDDLSCTHDHEPVAPEHDAQSPILIGS